MRIFRNIVLQLLAEPLTALHRRGLFPAALHPEAYDRAINILVGSLITCGIVASVILAARYLDRRSHYGIVFDSAWGKPRSG